MIGAVSDQAHDWDASYKGEVAAPWDIGRPQPIFVDLAERGLLTGDLFDAGCGTGENTLLAAEHGAAALGIDLSSTAIGRARAKARERGVAARFEAGDILTTRLPRQFDVVIDSGLFHVFDDTDRARYVATLAEMLRTGGVLYLACFSDRQPGDWGPRRVTRQELYDAFATGWSVEQVEPVEFEVNPEVGLTSTYAWLATVRR